MGTLPVSLLPAPDLLLYQPLALLFLKQSKPLISLLPPLDLLLCEPLPLLVLKQSERLMAPVLRVHDPRAEASRERRHGGVGAHEARQEAIGTRRAAVGTAAARRLGRRQLLRLLLALRLLAVQLLLLGLGDPGLARRRAATGSGSSTASPAALATYSSAAGARAAASSAASLGWSLAVTKM